MLRPGEAFITYRRSILLAVIALSCSFNILAQQPAPVSSEARDRGIHLYAEGDTKGAISALRAAVKQDRADGYAWYYLGLALVRADDLGNARKAFEAAVKLKPDLGFAHTGLAFTLMTAGKDLEAGREASRAIELNPLDGEAHYVLGVTELRSWRNTDAQAEADLAIAQKPKFAPAYLLKCQALLALEGEESSKAAKIVHVSEAGPLTEAERAERRRRARKSAGSFAAAADALQMYLKLSASDSETATWREELETLRAFATNGLGVESGVFGSWEVTTKVKILQKSEPAYTERARAAAIEGTVILRAVFSSAGTVEHILILRSLPAGLTEASIQAAKKIKFTPAARDGKPVSTIMELQYNFNFF
jgi:TonB family protein